MPGQFVPFQNKILSFLLIMKRCSGFCKHQSALLVIIVAMSYASIPKLIIKVHTVCKFS